MLETLIDLFLFLPEAFIMLHTMWFEILGEFPYILEDDGFIWAVFWLFGGTCMIVAILCVDIAIIGGIYWLIHEISIMLRTKEVKRQRVIGTVTGKKHIKEHTSVGYNVALKMPMLKSHSAEYIVEVEYNGITKTFDSKKLFKKYKKNDAIFLILVQNLDKNENPIKQRLELPE